MKKITSQKEDYAKWYTDVVAAADLADYAPVKGCMVIKPYGYNIWENMKDYLDKKIKETGHKNAYFPLFIPKSFLSREEEHAEGFAKECAVVTHSRLKTVKKGEKAEVVVDPSSKLEEELIVRPTSETIINSMFSKWIKSWRDLPLLINQWANIVRWEMRTRMFLRTTEFLWQEGHTAHATPEEAQEEAMKMLNMYKVFMEDILAIPVVLGKKTPQERFAGADETYTLEPMMQDGKALQAGTSHNLGQNFAKVFDIQFQDKTGNLSHTWQTSWGVTTRLIGALIMTHGDDRGIILPPEIAPVQIAIVPIYRSDEDREKVYDKAYFIKEKLADFRVEVDTRDQLKPGRKFYDWEKKGVPLRIELGPRDIAEDKLVLVHRITGKKESLSTSDFIESTPKLLSQFQADLKEKAESFLKKNTFELDDYEDFKKKIDAGGFFHMHWCGSADCEDKVKEETKATIRCIPLDAKKEEGKCIYCGKESKERALFAKAY